MGVVVVGMDMSETSTQALHEAVREAVWRDATVQVLHVINLPAYLAIELGVMVPDLGAIREAGEEAIERHVAEAATSYDDGFPVSVETKVVLGHAGTQILEAAAEHDAELVVLGSRGLGGFKGLMIGSVTTYAVHHLQTPLLIVPAADDDREVSG